VTSSGLFFGIYPFSVAGTPTGVAVGPPDNLEKIQLALAALRGAAKPLLSRTYLIYTGPQAAGRLFARVEENARAGLLGDLTIGTLDPDLELADWLGFVRHIVRNFGSTITALQITNEPNLAFMDGANPHVQQVLVQGVIAAKGEARAANLPVQIGFGSVPDAGPVVPHFWENLAATGGEDFVAALDYVAHNFYVDVFEAPLALPDIPATVERLLRRFRGENLTTGGIPAAVPIRITENGWPTGKNPFITGERSYGRQATVLESVIRTVYALREELNITHYELFGLRDAASAQDDLFHQFGIMRDDYMPKPAFSTYQRLIQELGN
jgi:hypothetical protein